LLTTSGPSIETVTPPCHDVSMTQLFDTHTYEDLEEHGATVHAPDAGRHLRSMPAGDDIPTRTTQWRLDVQTIEVGRKGIQAARQALQDAARTSAGQKPARKAA